MWWFGKKTQAPVVTTATPILQQNCDGTAIPAQNATPAVAPHSGGNKKDSVPLHTQHFIMQPIDSQLYKGHGMRLRVRLLLALILVCVAMLLLPYEGDGDAQFVPLLLHIPRHYKLFASFTMGLVVMGVVRG